MVVRPPEVAETDGAHIVLPPSGRYLVSVKVEIKVRAKIGG